MEVSFVKQQQQQQYILPDSTTTAIAGGKQVLTVINNPLSTAATVSAGDSNMDPTLTDILMGSENFFLNSNAEEFLSFQKSIPSSIGKKITHIARSSNM